MLLVVISCFREFLRYASDVAWIVAAIFFVAVVLGVLMRIGGLGIMFRRLFVLLVLAGYSLFGAVWHVSTTGNDAGGGRSWATAFGTLERALEVSRAGDEIWIAAGRYEPSASEGEISPESGYVLRPGVSVRGGFFGDEASAEVRKRVDRDGNGVVEAWEFAGETILRMPAGCGGTLLDGASEAARPTELDGLTVLGGNAFGAEDSTSHPGEGGGAYLNGQYVVRQCEFTGNHAVRGGGVFARGPVQVEQCLFAVNTATDQGGGIHLSQGDARVSSSLFLDNGSPRDTRAGGALSAAEDAAGAIAFCTFAGSASRDAGSALFLRGGTTVYSSVVWGSQGHSQGILADTGTEILHTATEAGGFPGTFAKGGMLLETDNAGENGVDANDNRPSHLFPCFRSPEDADFRLGRGSCLIGRGILPPEDAPAQDATGAPLVPDGREPSLGCYAADSHANAVVEISLPAPLYFGRTQPWSFSSDQELASWTIAAEDPGLLGVSDDALTGLHAGETRLLLEYTPADDHFAPGTVALPLQVLPRPLEVTADSRMWRSSEESFPELTWSLTAGSLLEGHFLSGDLKAYTNLREGSGEDREISYHTIRQGSLHVMPEAYSNDYQIHFREGLLTVLKGASTQVGDGSGTLTPGEDGISLVSELVYGDPLSGDLQLEGEILLNETGTHVPGTFSWEQEGETLPCGLYELTWIFTPEDASLPQISGTLPATVQERPLKIVPYVLQRPYGAANPEIPYLLQNFAPGEDESVVTRRPVLGCNATAASPAGEYPILLVEDGEAPNYRFLLEEGYLTVEPIALDVLVQSATKIHGEPDPEFTWSAKAECPVPAEAMPIQITRDPGESSGKYALHAVTANKNYLIRNNSAYLQIQGVTPVLHHAKTTPMKPFQTIREIAIDYAMKDPETGEFVPGTLEAEAYWEQYLDIPLTCVPRTIPHLFTPDDPDHYQGPVRIYVPYSMEQTKLTTKADDQTIVYGDPIPEFTYTVLEGELIPGVPINQAYLLREISSHTPTPLPAGQYVIMAGAYRSEIPSHGNNYVYQGWQRSGILTVEKRTAYLIVDDKEYTWGEEIPEFTCHFALDEKGLEPVWEDLFPFLTYEYHVGETGASGQATISITGILSNPNWTLKVVPGTLKCNPRTLTPQWPEDLHLRFWEDPPSLLTISADPAELPAGTVSFSTNSEVYIPHGEIPIYYYIRLTPDDEGYKDKNSSRQCYTWEEPGVHDIYLASDDTGDYRFRWDTTVPGKVTIGAETILLTNHASSMTEGRTFTRKLYKSNDDTEPEEHLFTVGKDVFSDLYVAIRNLLPGGVLWIDGDMGELGYKDIEIPIAHDVTIRKLHSPYWDVSVTLLPALGTINACRSLNLHGIELKNYLSHGGTFLAEDCIFRDTVDITPSSNGTSSETSPVPITFRKCSFTRDTWVNVTESGTGPFYAILYRGSLPSKGGALTLEDCHFKWVQERTGGYNIYIRCSYQSNCDPTKESELTLMRNVLNWPLDLTSCTFEGWQEEDPEILKTHFVPQYEDDPVIKFLLPEQ